ncbi:MAG: Zn-dependent oligopeptidase [Microbacterium ginsengisoli]|uniref:M3 family metallopeptidase n=1 Tax=Microbacterium TaxID=33882 RepID=UPI0006F93C6B|nr:MULTISPECIES: M3 family metallopeptidase [unclassified Microbacterium]MBN9199594.1 Zn-dependent oligopeptidase [Microbacterium ginsengisoli]KQR94289.1 peptidase M3 [Microbacterium sp. Leaf351]KQS02472.1 peptidase M3 [Microbacterium sp. Leaf347]ODU78214.1 MAG: peptidase M3 [Microbacterium sp. SCN 71-21]OJU76813.1 MAG: peptidase M3 [Microbacterium sp. 71-23]
MREPLQFPEAADAWLPFVTAFAADRTAVVSDVDWRLVQDASLAPIERLELWNEADIALGELLGAAYLISESHPDAAVREAAESAAQEAEALAAARLLNPDLWAVFAAADAAALDPLEQRLLSHIRRDFRRGGVDLDAETRERVRSLVERDTALSLAFSRNIRDGRREIRVPAEGLAGLPQDFIDAHPVDEDGLVTLTTEYTDLMPVREYARVRETRLALVAAYNDLAWPDNESVLAELLEVRAERARLLGYADWAEYETETRMIGSGAAIPAFLERLDIASDLASSAEYDRVLARLRQDAPDVDEVTIADFWYVLGAIKREEYDVDAQLVRSYFPFERVRDGILDVTGRLLDIEYVPVAAPTWHPDVASYDVVRGGTALGRIHLDLHPRPGKYSHAACFPLVPGIAGRQLPEAVLLCNFSRGLLEHDEVVTFFHEFGHLVHDILAGGQRWARFTGIQTEWDFVEAPSQLLEEWAWDAGVLGSFAANAAGEPIPADLVARMRTADAFGRALEVRRQLGHATVSYRLHVDRPGDLQGATERLYASTSPVQPLRGVHPYAGFGHLTGYGACYYTYQWSLVIARDLLSAFDGDLMNPDAAARYRTEVLERGGTRDARELVEAFLGRPFAFDAYRAWLAGE